MVKKNINSISKKNADKTPQQKTEKKTPRIKWLSSVCGIFVIICGLLVNIIGDEIPHIIKVGLVFVGIIAVLLASAIDSDHKHKWRWFWVSATTTLVVCMLLIFAKKHGAPPKTPDPLIANTGKIAPMPIQPPSPTPTMPQKRDALPAITRPPQARGTATPEPEPTIHPDVLKQGSVNGSVYDAETGQVLQGAIAVAQNDKTGIKYQGASGRDSGFHISVTAGDYTVTVSREGYIDVTQYCTTSYYGSQCGLIINMQKKPKQ